MEGSNHTQCREVNNVNTSYRCQFVLETASCNEHQGYLDYINFMYCVFQSAHGTWGAVAITVIWLIILFIALGVTADDFLCPALVVISKTLHLSQNIAGVTFLAFGNGAPDIFSSLAGIQQSRSDLVIGELFGAGVFVTTVVAGSICMGKPFKIMERPFLRDLIFYIWATFWAFCLFYSHQIRLRSAAGFVALYGVYIIVVIVSRLIYQKHKNTPSQLTDVTQSVAQPADPSANHQYTNGQLPTRPLAIILTPPEDGDAQPGSPGAELQPVGSEPRPVQDTASCRASLPCLSCFKSGLGFSFRHNLTIDGAEITRSLDERKLSMFKGSKLLDDPEAEGVVLRRFSYRSNLAIPRKRTLSHRRDDSPSSSTRRRSISDPVFVISSPASFTSHIKPKRPPLLQRMSTTSLASLVRGGEEQDLVRPWKDFLFEICPIDTKSWADRKWYSKTLDVIKAPVFFLLAITTPVVDFEAERQNWCKYLNVLHCVTGPLFITLCTNRLTYSINNSFPVWGVVLIISFAVAVFVFFTSIVDEPPRYHPVFAYLGFAVSVMWIYGLAHEIVALLQAIGIVFSLSDTILGLTVLAWGNSIGDFISNTSVAKQGFPRMGISACFGGPLLNLLLGIGIPYTVSLVQTGSPLELEYTKLVSVLYAALTVSLVSTLVTMTIMRFEVKKWFGVYLVLLYLGFLTVAILVETEVF